MALLSEWAHIPPRAAYLISEYAARFVCTTGWSNPSAGTMFIMTHGLMRHKSGGNTTVHRLYTSARHPVSCSADDHNVFLFDGRTQFSMSNSSVYDMRKPIWSRFLPHCFEVMAGTVLLRMSTCDLTMEVYIRDRVRMQWIKSPGIQWRSDFAYGASTEFESAFVRVHDYDVERGICIAVTKSSDVRWIQFSSETGTVRWVRCEHLRTEGSASLRINRHQDSCTLAKSKCIVTVNECSCILRYWRLHHEGTSRPYVSAREDHFVRMPDSMGNVLALARADFAEGEGIVLCTTRCDAALVIDRVCVTAVRVSCGNANAVLNSARLICYNDLRSNAYVYAAMSAVTSCNEHVHCVLKVQRTPQVEIKVLKAVITPSAYLHAHSKAIVPRVIQSWPPAVPWSR